MWFSVESVTPVLVDGSASSVQTSPGSSAVASSADPAVSLPPSVFLSPSPVPLDSGSPAPSSSSAEPVPSTGYVAVDPSSDWAVTVADTLQLQVIALSLVLLAVVVTMFASMRR